MGVLYCGARFIIYINEDKLGKMLFASWFVLMLCGIVNYANTRKLQLSLFVGTILFFLAGFYILSGAREGDAGALPTYLALYFALGWMLLFQSVLGKLAFLGLLFPLLMLPASLYLMLRRGRFPIGYILFLAFLFMPFAGCASMGKIVG